jgi:hypothetical protein
VGVQLAKEQLGTAGRQQIGRAVPADIAKGVKLGGDSGSGDAENGTILRETLR